MNKDARKFLVIAEYLLFGAAVLVSSVSIASYAQKMNSTYDTLPVVSNIESDESPISNPLGVVVIDPGHGGEDGGAVSSDGIAEKDLNLAVSENIADMCMLFGVPYKMTRTDDRLLYDMYSERDDYTGHKKSLDLTNRLRFTAEADARVFVGIHMNKFTDTGSRGTQIYYSPNNDNSQALASVMQDYIKMHLQPENNRKIKAADSSIYLLRRLTIPSILVECGFLSNPSELLLLTDMEYRSSLACTIFVPLFEYCISMS